MSLYLCVFEDDEADIEIDAVEVGLYSQFGRFRDAIAARAEGGRWGSRFPVLMGHPDSDGSWSSDEAARLVAELEELRSSLGDDDFLDVDGRPLIDSLVRLGRRAVEARRPIEFQ